MTEGIVATGISSVLIIGLAIILFLFWISKLADWARRDFKSTTDKVLWGIIIVLLQAPGAFLYWLRVQKKEKA
ncbi:MAG: hypothetical protein V1727_04390 [Candidatus Omnitrophota bacterium]